MSEFSTLEISRMGLLAQKFGLDVTSNNIANVNTPGFSRRDAVITESDPLFKSGKYLGMGAVSAALKSYREEFFDSEIRSNLSRHSAFKSDDEILSRLEAILAEPSDYSLGNLTARFFNAFENLSLNPQSAAHRENLISTAGTMTDRFHFLADSLNDTRRELKTNIELNVDKANSLISEIAGLNKNIARASASASKSQGVQTYIDDREKKLEELSELADIKISDGKFGTVNVFLNGINIITGPDYSKIQINETVNNVTGERTLRLLQTDTKGNSIGSLSPKSGELASQLNHYNVTLDDADSSGSFSVFSKLNDYANAVVQSVNDLTIGGFGLDDTGPNPPGRNFFEPAAGDATAFTIEINQEIIDDVRKIPTASVPAEPGNNDIALAISKISQDINFLDDLTPSEFYSGLISKLGSASKEAVSGKNNTQLVSEQLEGQRDSIIGVNLDEEAVNLIRYQKAFEASSRVMSTMNQMLSTLINIGR